MTATLVQVRQLDTLANRVCDLLAHTRHTKDGAMPEKAFSPDDVLPLYERWQRLRDELVRDEPELASLPPVTIPTTTTGAFGRYMVERLRAAVADASDVLNHPSRAAGQVSIDREGIFSGGRPFDAMLAIAGIIRAAVRSVEVVDAYVSEETLGLLSTKADAVAVRILTHAAKQAFVQAARLFNAQYSAGPPVEVRTSGAFHDRFLVVDGTDFYHFGTSIKDAAKKNTFMFSRIEEPKVITTLNAEFTSAWAVATIVTL